MLSVVCIVLGGINLFSILIIQGKAGDRGTASLLWPLIPLNIITALEIFMYYSKAHTHGDLLWPVHLAYDCMLVCIAAAWLLFTYYHYALNEVGTFTRRHSGVLSCAWFILIAATFAAHTFSWMRILTFIRLTAVLMLYLAGTKAVLIRQKTSRLLPSSRIALAIAIISMVSYPGIAVGELLGFRLPYLDKTMTFWVQAHPIYFLLINVPLAGYIIKTIRDGWRAEAERPLPSGIHSLEELTKREREVLVLVYQGHRYTEIADKLCVSLPTVKTHIHRCYQKLGISHRGELYSLFSSQV